MSSWSLRDQFRKAIDRWYLILGLIIIGAVLGYAAAWIFPAPYRAEADLYVGIDITRVNEMEYLIPLAREEPLNLDDYKNWQLKQLADILYSDRVLEATLNFLQESDPAWQSVNLSDFRRNIDIYWYDTGIWRLEYLDSDKNLAQAAVKAWLDAGYDYVSSLLIFSQQVAELDADLEINKDAASVLKVQAARLERFLQSAEEWQEILSSQERSSPLPTEQQIELDSWLSSYQNDIELGGMEDIPRDGADVQEISDWVEMAYLKADTALIELEEQLDILAQERQEILPAYHELLDDSLGLSANIVLQENSSVPSVHRIRDRGATTLAGAGLGFLVWVAFALIQYRGSMDD